MIKTTAIFILIFSCITNYAQKNGNNFLKLSFDSVVMYDFGNQVKNEEDIEIITIIDGNTLSYSVVKSVKLKTFEIKNLNKLLSKKEAYGGNAAVCFEPHLGFVYYQNNIAIAHLDVCLKCNRLYSTLSMNSSLQRNEGQGKGEIYLIDGMGDVLKNALNELLKKYNFSHQLNKN